MGEGGEVGDSGIVVTLDIGGSGVKASAFDVVGLRSIASASEPYPASSFRAGGGECDVEAWWRVAIRALRALVEVVGRSSGEYLGVTVSALRIPVVLLNAHREVVRASILNADRRAGRQVEEIVSTVGAAELYRTTGHWAAPEFGLAKLLWIRQNDPEVWRSVRLLLQFHDWFIFKLSGTGAVRSERSSAAMSQLLDVSSGTWAVDLLAEFSISLDLLPDLGQAGEIVGGVCREVATETGLRQGLPVHIGGGDTHFSAMSAGEVRESVPVVVAGSTAPVQVALRAGDALPLSNELAPILVSPHLRPGIVACEANAGATGSIVTRLLNLGDEAADYLLTELRARQMAVSLPGSGEDRGELVVLAGNPFFGPEGWASSPHPTVIGLRPEHTGRDVVLAALEGTCFAIRSMLECLRVKVWSGDTPVFVTGGMSANATWDQMLADITGRTVKVPALEMISGRAGAAVVTGEELGLAPEEAVVATYLPDAAQRTRYEGGYEHYRTLYRRAQDRSRNERTVADACTC